LPERRVDGVVARSDHANRRGGADLPAFLLPPPRRLSKTETNSSRLAYNELRMRSDPKPASDRRPGRGDPAHTVGIWDGLRGDVHDTVLFESGLLVIGRFEVAPEEPDFAEAGRINLPVFVFPRTSCRIRHRGASEFVADPCIVTFFDWYQPYSRQPVDPTGDRADWFKLRSDAVEECLRPYPRRAFGGNGRVFPFPYVGSDDATFAAERHLVRLLRKSPAPDPLVVEETVIGLLSALLRNALGEPRGGAAAFAEASPSRAAEIADDVRVLLNRRYDEPLSLNEIGRALGVSVSAVCHAFRDATGGTIHRYRNRLRLRRSLDRLTEGADDLTDLALDLGFSSHSHFSELFRRTFGLTPSRFRADASPALLERLRRRLVQAG